MDYSFSRAFGETFKVDSFSNVMKFIHAYNETKGRIGSTNESEIIAAMRGYDEVTARKILAAIKSQFGHVPAREDESKFMQDYYKYMKETYDAQRKKVSDARKQYEEKKEYKAPNGVKYSGKELAEAGPKAKRNAAGAKWAKFALIAVGAIAGSYLIPLLLTTVFTGVAAVSTISAITMIGSVAGLVGGGILGARIFNAGGRAERLKANSALAKFWAEMQDVVSQDQSQLEAEESKLKELEKEFGLEKDETTGMMDSPEFQEVFSEYASGPVATPEEERIEPEDEIVDDGRPGRTPEEPETPEVPAEPETPEVPEEPETPEVPEEPETPEVPEEPETPEVPEEPETPEVPEEPETPEVPEEPETPEVPEEPETPEVPEEPETPEVPEGPETPETPEGPETPVGPGGVYDEPATEEKKKKIISTLSTRYTNSINVCSSVGRYMLIDSREGTLEAIRNAKTMGEVKEIVDAALPKIDGIKNDYKKYVANKSSNNVTRKNVVYLEELPADKQGAHASDDKLPDDFISTMPAKTHFAALAASYIRQNEAMIRKYTKAKDEELSPAKRKANARELYAKAAEVADSGLDFAEIDKTAMEFQTELASKIQDLNVGSISTTIEEKTEAEEVVEETIDEPVEEVSAEEVARVEKVSREELEKMMAEGTDRALNSAVASAMREKVLPKIKLSESSNEDESTQ